MPTSDSSVLPAQSLLPSLQIKPLSSHIYTALFPQHFCIGSVPHGGYISSVFLSVASQHFSTTLRAQKQPDTFILGLNFLRRTATGPALFRVKDVKIGRQTSVIHITLLQGGKDWSVSSPDAETQAVEEVAGYITNTNFDTESGPTIPTGWSPTPEVTRSSFPSDTSDSSPGPGPEWQQITSLPFQSFRKATAHIDLWMPSPSICQSLPKGRIDQWVRMRSGEKWTNLHLGYLADYFPLLIEFMEPATKNTQTSTSTSLPSDSSSPTEQAEQTHRPAKHWYPTLVLNLDIKLRLPQRGEEWLGISAQMRNVRNGRDDIEIVIWDREGRIVALSHHVCLVVDVGRNVAGRRTERINKVGGNERKQGNSKI